MSADKKRICILVFANIAFDIRVQRQIEAARKHYQVDVIAHGEWKPPEGAHYIPLPKTILKPSLTSLAMLLFGNMYHPLWEKRYWRQKEYRQAVEIIQKTPYDLIHANDLNALPVAVKAAASNNARVLFDAHEFYLAQGVTKWAVESRRPFRKYLFNTYGVGISRMITVSAGIANLYFSEFGWKSDIVLNAPHYIEHEFHPVDPSHINIVNQGSAIRGRRIEDLIMMMKMVDPRYHLFLLLKPSQKDYYEELKLKASQIAPDRVTLLDTVPPQNITHEINKFDIGIHILDANNLNHFYALPKKIFEYVMAGLGIVVTPLEEMKKLVQDTQIGTVAEDHSWAAMAKALNALTPEQINIHKKNSLHLAKTLNADHEMGKLMEIYAVMLAG